MKKIKFVATMLVASCIVCICATYIHASKPTVVVKKSQEVKKAERNSNQVEEEMKAVTEIFGDELIINEERIATKAKTIAENSDKEYKTAFDEIKNQAIEEKSMYLAAKDAGCEVTEDEINAIIENAKNELHNDSAIYEEFKTYWMEQSITEKDYWEIQQGIYEGRELISKYLQKCYEEQLPNDDDIDAWRDGLVQQAVDKYKVTVE